MHIFVGSTNPVKTNSVAIAASEQWPDVIVKGFSVSSDVPEQPMTDEETKKGSINRSKNALETGVKMLSKQKKQVKKFQVLGLGLEGGVFLNKKKEMWSTVWASVVDLEGNTFSANGARFKISPIIADPIIAGEEMGPVVSKLFKEENIKQKQGAIGAITQGFMDRTEEYAGITKLALGLWYGREWEKSIV